MKKIILTTLSFIFILGFCFSQDVITKKSGEDIKAKILEIGQTEVKYKKFDNQDGPTYTILKSDLLMIRYENGTKDIFSESNKSPELTTSIVGTHDKVRQDVTTNNKFKNRIGLIMCGGGGFQNIPFVELTDGTIATISFGGDYAVQFEYGYEVNKYFDLAINIGGQFSELSQTVSNGSASFNRSIVSLTPSYILPIAGGDKMRFKFGAGIDLLYNAELNFDLSKVSGGTKDDWKYNGGLGGHLSIIFEILTPKRFSFNAGIRYQNANYEFKSGAHSYPTDNDLKNPNGSGIYILLGVNYSFNWVK
jgi:hypothetical protein